jgi:acyl-CoA synthetase (AMP-forming)/AMP-acid ligase II
MNANMMQQPLLISTLLTHAERHHGDQEIVSRRVEGDLHRQTYSDLGQRARRMANALAAKGICFGDREPHWLSRRPVGLSQTGVV